MSALLSNVVLSALVLSGIAAGAAAPNVGGINWTKETVSPGLEWSYADNVELFGKNMNVDLLTVKPGARKLSILDKEGSLSKTSSLAQSAGSLAAINGGYA